MSPAIDSHQHFWRYTAEEFGWIGEDLRAIRRDFLPADLAPALRSAGVSGTVAVQARQTLEETRWLLELARSHPLIRGVVGWVPLADPGLSGVLDDLADEPMLKGVRHVLQGEPDAFMADPAFNAGIRRITSRGLSYDLLVLARQLPSAIRFVDAHPRQRIVLDHIAKPVISGPPPAEWRRRIRELARRPHVSCKFSGLVTEVRGGRWLPALLEPYFDAVLEAFGPRRLMFGSDWPVCLGASGYQRWAGFVRRCARRLSPSEGARILGGNAAEFYRLSTGAPVG
jgi:L-fuconolactonase